MIREVIQGAIGLASRLCPLSGRHEIPTTTYAMGGGEGGWPSKHKRVSDLSGREAPDKEFGRLVVRKYPGMEGNKVLDVLPDEVSGLKTPDDMVELEYIEPGSSKRRTLMVERDAFDALADNMPELLANIPDLKPGRPVRNGT